LDCPHYSRPERLAGDSAAVPDVLLSGNHEAVERWRRERSLELTARRRPDLIQTARAAGQLSAADERYLKTLLL
jgi:tRNA (guanine37-N1)-methyltransferase